MKAIIYLRVSTKEQRQNIKRDLECLEFPLRTEVMIVQSIAFRETFWI